MILQTLLTLYLAHFARAVTVYGQIPLGQTVSTAAGAQQTSAAAYNDTLLTPPPVPSPAPARNIALQLQRDAAQTTGLSIPHNGGGFFGFSIEMSVVQQVSE